MQYTFSMIKAVIRAARECLKPEMANTAAGAGAGAGSQDSPEAESDFELGDGSNFELSEYLLFDDNMEEDHSPFLASGFGQSLVHHGNEVDNSGSSSSQHEGRPASSKQNQMINTKLFRFM